jgi:hypothetical protein
VCVSRGGFKDDRGSMFRGATHTHAPRGATHTHTHTPAEQVMYELVCYKIGVFSAPAFLSKNNK